jgi:hypothetical protein
MGSVPESSVFFGGADEIDGAEIIEVGNYETDIDLALKHGYGWKGKAIGAIGLALSPDNLRVASGTFITCGSLDLKDKKIAANLIWPTASANTVLVIKFPSANDFIFDSSCGLWSNILSDNSVSHAYYDATEGRGGQPLLGEDTRRAGTHTGFSLRMMVQISSMSSPTRGVILKYVILLFPTSAEELEDTPESKFAGWPGLKIAEGTMPLGPAPKQPWQCPILPFLKPTNAFQQEDVAPASNKLRAAIAGIMRNAYTADILKVGVHSTSFSCKLHNTLYTDRKMTK